MMTVCVRACVFVVLVCVVAAQSANVAAAAEPIPPYDNSTAFTYFTLAVASYRDNATLSAWNCTCCQLAQKLGLEVEDVRFMYHKESDTFGYALYERTNDMVVLSFRGTVGLVNWLYNLEASKTTPYKHVPHVRVHKGFYDAYMNIQSQVHAAVVSLSNTHKTDKVLITGHSLGAALATLCHLDLAESFPAKEPGTGLLFDTHLWSYGEPRLGNQEFADYWVKTVYPGARWRVVHYKDIVPHVPPEDMNFRHVVQEVWYGEEDSDHFTVCSATDGEDSSCSDSVVGDSVYDHLHYFEHTTTCEWSPPSRRHAVKDIEWLNAKP